MTTHVLVKSGIVVQCDLTGNCPEGFVPAPDGVVPGFLMKGKRFVAPSMTPSKPPVTALTRPQMLHGLRAENFITEEEFVSGAYPDFVRTAYLGTPADMQAAAEKNWNESETFTKSNPIFVFALPAAAQGMYRQFDSGALNTFFETYGS